MFRMHLVGPRQFTWFCWRSAVSVLLWCLATAAPLGAQHPAVPLPPTLAFTGVTVVDVTDGRLLSEQTVVVAGNRIQTVGPAASVRVLRGAQMVKAKGKYLIPGLWDMHIHPKDHPDVFYPLLIATGVTGIRDAGTSVPLDTVRRWQREIASGTRVGPRQVVAGRYLDKRDDGFSFKVATPAEARHAIDSLQTTGADFVKVHLVTPEVYVAIVAEARRAGLPVGGHAPPRIPLTDASDSGVSIIDHSHSMRREGRCMGDSASLERCTPVAERFRRNGTWHVPTLLLHTALDRHRALSATLRAKAAQYWPDSMLRQSFSGAGMGNGLGRTPAQPDSLHRPNRVDVMQQAGMPLLAGTDASPIPSSSYFPGAELVPGFSLHEELATLVWAGLTPLGALQAATLNPARALQATDSLGTVAPGKVADLVLLDANPLADIANTTTVRAVVANGRYFDRAALDALLARVERAAQRP